MRSYGIYKVKKRYEPFIIGREELLNELLIENRESLNSTPEVKYLCEILEQQKIDEAILSNLGKVFKTVECANGEYKLTHPVKGTITITLSSYALTVCCDGSRMLDLDLFVALSEAGNRFFAVMEEQGEWGWLKPIKHKDILAETTAIFR